MKRTFLVSITLDDRGKHLPEAPDCHLMPTTDALMGVIEGTPERHIQFQTGCDTTINSVVEVES